MRHAEEKPERLDPIAAASRLTGGISDLDLGALLAAMTS